MLITLLLVKTNKPIYASAVDFYNVLKVSSNIPVNFFAINDYYYITSERNKELFVILFQIQKLSDYIIAGFGYIYTMYLLWNLCFKRIINVVKSKIIYFLMILSCLSPAILFLIACDYGRWYIYIINAFYTLAMF
ncbi:MAG TPA: hypothetical protein PKO10_04640, partial [Aliarcobacter cryaerophilus]|nr:hypothetical protein [Aliarcobacter cryaerophilus]